MATDDTPTSYTKLDEQLDDAILRCASYPNGRLSCFSAIGDGLSDGKCRLVVAASGFS